MGLVQAAAKSKGGDMEIRLHRLSRSEHGMTRPLWEKVFVEDTKAFLDYYYGNKTIDNDIYAAKDGAEICGMLQLNPYNIRVGTHMETCNYIIAVCTLEEYRRKGIMARLLKMSMQDMYEKGQPFIYLMPAKESIYYPFDFRYIYRQPKTSVTGAVPEADICVREAGESDCTWMAQAANRVIAEKAVLYAHRDTAYYARSLKEQRSEEGGILIVERAGRKMGHVLYAKAEEFELHEPIMEEDEQKLLEYAVYHLTKSTEKQAVVRAYAGEGMEEVPIIMARILNLEKMLSLTTAKENLNIQLHVIDEFLLENSSVYQMTAKKGAAVHAEKVNQETNEVISIAALTSVIFGYQTVEEALAVEGKEISGQLKRELEKIIPLSPIFINEIV